MNWIRLSRRLATCVIAAILLAGACRHNHPPATPDLAGPHLFRLADTAKVIATSTDQDDDWLSYLFAWGDSSNDVWLTDYPNGYPALGSHVYPDSGTYVVKARARDDKGAESDWSLAETLRVGNFLPGIPPRPVGPAVWLVDSSYECTTYATSPFGESLLFQVEWGGRLRSWSAPVANGSRCVAHGNFGSAGVYSIRARTKDKVGAISAWSDSLVVNVSEERPYAPHQLIGPRTVIVNTPATYSTWSEDPNGDSIRYIFRWDWDVMDTTELYRSGDTVPRSHAWPGIGSYFVLVRTVDSKGNPSLVWGGRLGVQVVEPSPNHPPDAPGIPVHSGSLWVDSVVYFTTSAYDPENDSVRVKFYFGDGGTPAYGPAVASGASYTDSVIYRTGGSKAVRAVAMDARGDTSAWSMPDNVHIGDSTGTRIVTGTVTRPGNSLSCQTTTPISE